MTGGWQKGFLAALSLAVAGPAALGQDGDWPSGDGLYRVSIQPDHAPVEINRLHRWMLAVTDAAGEPVQGARITLRGGMPEHNHGLPTAPRVTRETEPGVYLLEGVRFHMRGGWELVFRIEAAAGNDTVRLSFDL